LAFQIHCHLLHQLVFKLISLVIITTTVTITITTTVIIINIIIIIIIIIATTIDEFTIHLGQYFVLNKTYLQIRGFLS